MPVVSVGHALGLAISTGVKVQCFCSHLHHWGLMSLLAAAAAAEEGNGAGDAPGRFGLGHHKGLRAGGVLVALPGPVKCRRGWCGVGSLEKPSWNHIREQRHL